MKTKNKLVTRFMDMHSGGHLKTSYTHIYIDEPLGEAVQTFKDLFKRDPNHITCKCCGEDFVYEQYDSLEDATAYDRKCDWVNGKYNENCKMTVEEYFRGDNKVLFITE